jgi:hypothetical protein
MTIEEIKNYEDLYCQVTGFHYLDSFTSSKVINGSITIKGELVIVTNGNDDTEIEVHYEEIKA